MLQSGRWIELVVRVAESKLEDQLPRGRIRRIVAGKKPSHVKLLEGVCDHGLSGLDGQALTPECGADASGVATH